MILYDFKIMETYIYRCLRYYTLTVEYVVHIIFFTNPFVIMDAYMHIKTEFTELNYFNSSIFIIVYLKADFSKKCFALQMHFL